MATAQRKLSATGWAGIILAGGLTFYWMQTYTGPFEWFAELQLRWMGEYTEKLTFMLTFLVAYGVLALLYLPVRRVLRSGSGGPAGAAGGGRDLSGLSGSLVAGLVGLGFAVAGAVQYARAQHAGELADTPVAQLEAGQAPASRWVRVSGYAVPDAALTMESNRKKSYYIPVVSSLTLDPSKSKIHLFLKYDDNRSLPGQSEQPVTFQGMIEHNDLPGPLRVTLEQQSAIDPDNYYVLEPNKTPAKAMSDAKIMSYIGLAIFGIGIILAIVAWLRRPAGVAPVDRDATPA